jgi:hypothetical protein
MQSRKNRDTTLTNTPSATFRAMLLGSVWSNVFMMPFTVVRAAFCRLCAVLVGDAEQRGRGDEVRRERKKAGSEGGGREGRPGKAKQRWAGGRREGGKEEGSGNGQ